jgi:hypothetical protein
MISFSFKENNICWLMKQHTDVLSKHSTMMCHGLIYFHSFWYEIEEKVPKDEFTQSNLVFPEG